ncbi:MAG: type III ribulose-bisphosphate carboxylase [Candidatus Diapherotrites archaeon]|uniref:Ribulose bisphosphate carboxylase n=1 Tax=Candidatus Iainarchaeum sp. TaxID=3101447 RepID=A0A938YW86_9ARCH|nr:type III ribulose-bisphosphate carboxylase [Candidatus Diapherotrites archaeon]
MEKSYSGYLEPGYKPRDDLVALFYLQPGRRVSFNEAAQAVASESSIGTWTDISTLSNSLKRKLHARVFSLNRKSRLIEIAYPKELFEEGNIPQLLSSVAGNVFGMKEVRNLRLLDINFPNSYIKSFKGPKFGIQGVRKTLRVKKRPLLGSIVKPKLGLDEKQHAQVAFQAWAGGCDIVKDDENLSSLKFNNFEKRVKETLKMRRKAEQITGEKKAYMPNVTAPFNEMMRRARFVKKAGGRYAMADIVTVGWSALQDLRDADLGLLLHAHRAGHAAFTLNEKHGISMLMVAKLARLAGLDQIHVGAIVGKMQGRRQEVQAIGEEIEHSLIRSGKKQHILSEKWLHVKPMLAVCSGGLHPGKVPPLLEAMGNDIVVQMGGGIHGHPLGTMHGAIAARQSVDAAMKKIPLREYAEQHKDLQLALRKWQ